jgi:hypothetical protein
MGNPDVHRGRNHGSCYVFFIMRMIYHGCVKEISMRPYIAMNRSEAMKSRNGVWRDSGKLWIIVASETWSTLACHILGITNDKV